MSLSSLRRGIALVAVFAFAGLATAADDGFTSLFNGKSLDGWKTFPEALATSLKAQDGVLIVPGKPNGYFYTDKSFTNFTFKWDWRYARPDGLTDETKFRGNSGMLFQIQTPHKTWPKSIEVQGMNLNAGMLLSVSGAKGKYTFDKAAKDKAVKPVGEWNTTEATVQGDTITVKVNGVEVAKGTFEPLGAGPIGLQSEGAEIHFRNIMIKELK